jgi:hypothetical protein
MGASPGELRHPETALNAHSRPSTFEGRSTPICFRIAGDLHLPRWGKPEQGTRPGDMGCERYSGVRPGLKNKHFEQ